MQTLTLGRLIGKLRRLTLCRAGHHALPEIESDQSTFFCIYCGTQTTTPVLKKYHVRLKTGEVIVVHALSRSHARHVLAHGASSSSGEHRVHSYNIVDVNLIT